MGSRKPAPLGEVSIMANSILDFVLEHPEYHDHLKAYNAWSQTRHVGFSLGSGEMIKMAIELFDSNINRTTREHLLILKEIEDTAAQ